MGTGYLIDTNSVIDFLNKRLPEQAREFLIAIEPAISVITQIEIFSKRDLPTTERSDLQAFVEIARTFLLDEDIALKTIEIRIKYKTKLPDAIIAATAIHYDLSLITHNVSDFKRIVELEVIDPYTL